MDNEQLYEQAKTAIDELFSDTSVSQEKAMENLQGLISEIHILMDALTEDMEG